MSVKASVILAIAFAASVAPPANAHAPGPALSHERTGDSEHVYSAVLTSGVRVRHVVYAQERLGREWLLQIRHAMGLMIESQEGVVLPALTQADARELMGLLFEAIRLDHEGRLDEIQIDVQSIESLQESGVVSLRAARIPPKHDPFKSLLLLSASMDWLEGEDLVKNACADLAFLMRKCSARSVGMNPPGFRHEPRLKHWEDARNIPDLGIRWDSMWFAIRLAPVDPER
jgi:hypothetical protein